MITVQRKIQLIESTFGKGIVSSSGENIAVVCPFCKQNRKVSHQKRKLSINLSTGVYHCWVCESKGPNIGKVALRTSIQKDAAYELLACFKRKNKEIEEVEVKKLVQLPEDFRLIAKSYEKNKLAKLGAGYLIERGFTIEDMWRFKVGVSDQYQFINRVIFPSFDANQRLNYFVARTFEKDNKRRYFNCKDSRKNIIFNEFDIDFQKELVIVEGVFDLLNCPENSTCILGSWMSKNYMLFQKIVENKTPVILCLDPDAMSKTQKISKTLYEFCVDVRISQHKDKDFADMTREEVNYWIDTAKRFDNINRVSYLIKGIKSGSIF